MLGTQIVATLIAVYGLFMAPLGWGWALFVWGYALAWFLVNDRLKLLAYRILDPAKAGAAPEARPQRGPDVKTGAKPEAKVDPKPGTKAEATPDAYKTETSSDVTPQIAKQAYELYEQQGRHDGHADQDWLQAEREIRHD